jgi:hypothetical protein
MGQSIEESAKSIRRRWRFEHPGAVAVAAGVLLSSALLLAVRESTDGTTTGSGVVGAVVVVAALLLGVAAIVQMLSGDPAAARHDAATFTGDPDQRDLLARWLTRARWARAVGGCSGVVWWILSSNGSGDILLCAFGGIAIGAMIAELHHVRRRPGPTSASLDVRSLDDYLDTDARSSMRMAAMIAAAAAVVGVIGGHASTVAWAASGLVVLGAVVAVQHRVAVRPRPGVADRFRRADDLVRWLAVSRGLAQPGTVLTLALAAHALWILQDDGIGELSAIAIWLVALVNWWRSRGLHLGEPTVEAVAVAS